MTTHVGRVCRIGCPNLHYKKAIKFAHGRINSLVAPHEFPILQMYLLELASIESVAEPDNAAPINIGTVLISGTIDLVEISSHEPSRTLLRLLAQKLLE